MIHKVLLKLMYELFLPGGLGFSAALTGTTCTLALLSLGSLGGDGAVAGSSKALLLLGGGGGEGV